MTNCQEIMTKSPACCLASDKVYTSAQRMQSENVGALPVVENYETKKLIGIVTDRDLAVKVVGASRDATNTRVGDVMTPNPVVCHPADDLDTTLEVMASHQIRRIPVVDEHGQVVGIIAQADVAIRLDNHDKVGQMVGQISQPDLASARWRDPVQAGIEGNREILAGKTQEKYGIAGEEAHQQIDERIAKLKA